MDNFKYETLFKAISEQIDLPDNAVIADLGCKDATFLLAFQEAFPNDATYNSDIVDYLNERDDIYYNDMVFILEELGFAVFEDGTVKW